MLEKERCSGSLDRESINHVMALPLHLSDSLPRANRRSALDVLLFRAPDVLLLQLSTDQSAEDEEEAERHMQLGRLLWQVCPPRPRTRQCRAANGKGCRASFPGSLPLNFPLQGILLGLIFSLQGILLGALTPLAPRSRYHSKLHISR